MVRHILLLIYVKKDLPDCVSKLYVCVVKFILNMYEVTIVPTYVVLSKKYEVTIVPTYVVLLKNLYTTTNHNGCLNSSSFKRYIPRKREYLLLRG